MWDLVHDDGVGSTLHNILRQRHGVVAKKCDCREWIEKMNTWGPDGCREHMDEIADHLFSQAATNPQVSKFIRLAVNIPLLGVAAGKAHLKKLITDAIHMIEHAPSPATSQAELSIRLQSPADKWPKGWRNWPNVVEYHRGLLRAAVDEAARIPLQERKANATQAVLIPAGGRCTIYDKNAPQYYFWGAFAVAWNLRSRGCTLPIQFWFLPGEMEEIEHCELYARRVAATCHVIDTTDMRCVHGWQVKINAILQSEYDEVLHLDADCLPVQDPTFVFELAEFREHAALFWRDNPNVNDFHGYVYDDLWRRMGEPRRDRIPDIEAGQMFIDKVRGARALHVVKHLADHADYWGGYNGGDRGVWYGDKTDFHMGFLLTKTPYRVEKWNKWNPGGFYEHLDPNGQKLFQHACHRKGNINNGHHIPNLDRRSNQYLEEAAKFKSPLEFLDGSLDDAMRVMKPELHFEIDDRIGLVTWMDVLAANEYLLGPSIPSDAVVIDVGVNSGAFSYACLRRGAGKVVGFEPGPVARLARNNLVEFGLRSEVFGNVVWRSDVPDTEVSLSFHHAERHSGSLSAVLGQSPSDVKAQTVGLDTVLRRYDVVHILKLDCEGSEFPILYTSKELHRCEHILGEYHNGGHPEAAGDIEGGWKPWTMDALKEHLESQGFEVYRVKPYSPQHGLFWARRRA
jgi:FkbM family methyltransferase